MLSRQLCGAALRLSHGSSVRALDRWKRTALACAARSERLHGIVSTFFPICRMQRRVLNSWKGEAWRRATMRRALAALAHGNERKALMTWAHRSQVRGRRIRLFCLALAALRHRGLRVGLGSLFALSRSWGSAAYFGVACDIFCWSRATPSAQQHLSNTLNFMALQIRVGA